MALMPPLNGARSCGRRFVGFSICVVLASAWGNASAADEWSGRFLGSYAADIDHVQLAVPSPVVVQPDRTATGHSTWAAAVAWTAIGGMAATDVETGTNLTSGAMAERISLGIVNWSDVVRPGAQDPHAQMGLGMSIALTPSIDLLGSVRLGTDVEGRPSLAPEYRELALVASFRF